MPVVAEAKSAGSFKPLPFDTLVPVVISKVTDQGEQAIPSQYQREGGPKTRRVMQMEFSDGNGGSSISTYTLSTSEKATIVLQLKKAGIVVPPNSRFDYETLVGSQLQVLTEGATNKTGKPYAKIVSFAKPQPNQHVASTASDNGVPKANIPGPVKITDEDIAF
jgi:hypothetical protein